MQHFAIPAPQFVKRVPFCTCCNDITETYVVDDANETILGEVIGYVTEITTGLTVAHYRSGATLTIGVPLCAACDTPVEG